MATGLGMISMVDWAKIRRDFPSLERTINGRPVVYLDSACMALKPRQVIDAMNEYYEMYPACGGRSIHRFGKDASEAYTAARGKFAKFLNASQEEECIWTRNATESLNIVASSVELPKGSKIITTSLEHHSGSLPFVERAKRDNLQIEIIKAQNDGTFDIEDWKKAIDNNTSLVSVVHSSNVTGTIAPMKEIVEIAHDRGALVMCDDAQYAPHHPLDVQSADVDFSAISVHKMCGPTGMGVLYGKMEHLKSMKMALYGGDTVSDVKFEAGKILPEYLPPPEKFEAGLQNYAGAIGAGAAADYLQSIGMHEIEKHERSLLEVALKKMLDMEHVHILGTEDISIKTGLVTFSVDTVPSAHDVATFLNDEYNIMIRSGAHCVHPFHHQLGISIQKGTARASFYLYNNMEDVKAFLDGLENLIEASA
ncbi:MAG: aminotransferase class V-fold PLP-dependent enzyme [Candidatus Thorarchaeota archaeon]|nr:aminotransferase class V-fold PLP-dependent enzyme [Candidatus Thorarchaeota archaeon]